MKLKKLKRRRHVEYRAELTDELPGEPVFGGEGYEAFKLPITHRSTDPDMGESDYLIRETSNNLRFLIVYCLMERPGEVSSVSYWVNNKVPLPDGEIALTDELVDPEKASYFLMDFLERFVRKKYTLAG